MKIFSKFSKTKFLKAFNPIDLVLELGVGYIYDKAEDYVKEKICNRKKERKRSSLKITFKD